VKNSPFKQKFKVVVVAAAVAAAVAVAVSAAEVKGKLKTEYSSSWESVTELRGVTCHMGSHTVTCHPTQVNVPRRNPSQPAQYSISLTRKDGRLS